MGKSFAIMVGAFFGLSSMAAGVAAAAPAAVTVDCARNPGTLQPTLDTVAPGSVIVVAGRCVGTFTISQDLTVQGRPGATLDGGGNGPVLSVAAGVYAALDNVVVTGGGSAAVGGIRNFGHLTLRRSDVRGNRAVGAAPATEAVGGIHSAPAATATLIVSDSRISGNQASYVTAGTTAVGAIGGVRADGVVQLTDVELNDNEALADSAGPNRAFGGLAISVGGALLDRVEVSDNRASSVHTGLTGTGLPAGAVGGIVRLSATQEVRIDRATIQRNRATASSAVGSAAAGGLNIRNATLARTRVLDNAAEAGTLATGGFTNFDSVVTLDGSSVSGNVASALDVNGIATGGVRTGFATSPTSATTSLLGTDVTRNEAFGPVATGGISQVPGQGAFVLDRAKVTHNNPSDCDFVCQP